MASRKLGPSSHLQELRQQQQQQQQMTNHPQIPIQQSSSHLDHQSTQDDFLEQMLSNLPASWADLSGNPKSPWDHHINPQNLNNNTSSTATNSNSNDHKLFKAGEEQQQYPYDESTLLALRLQQHQISGNSPKPMMLQQQLLLSRGAGAPTSATDASSFGAADPDFFQFPPHLGSGGDASDSHLPDSSVQGLFNSLTGSVLPRNGQTANQQHFHHPQTPNFSAIANGMNQFVVAGTTGGGDSTITSPVKQKVRARRGQATDPHSIAERLRRERIAERMRVLQELVPNANKTDKASMLDEIINYVKFLQLQVKVLSMSRLGGAGVVAPLVADISAEGGGCIQGTGGANSSTNGAPAIDNSLTVMENQAAKLMEEYMGSAMQYLQGKGLCLMPISLASTISTAATCQLRNSGHSLDGPASPNLPTLTVHSTTLANGSVQASIKDAKSC